MAGAIYLGSSRIFPIHSTKEAANLTSITIPPSTSTQVINATGMLDGYNTVTVPAVTNAIDPAIAPENIRNGISILNVTGNYMGPKALSAGNYTFTSTNGTTYTIILQNADNVEPVVYNANTKIVTITGGIT